MLANRIKLLPGDNYSAMFTPGINPFCVPPAEIADLWLSIGAVAQLGARFRGTKRAHRPCYGVAF